MNEERPIACGYIRVNADDHAKRDIGLKSQLSAIRRFCLDHDWDLVEVVEQAATPTPGDNRPQFKSMIDRATDGTRPFDAIVVTSTSRFARDHAQFLTNYDRLSRADIRVMSVLEEFKGFVSSANFANINPGRSGRVDTLE